MKALYRYVYQYAAVFLLVVAFTATAQTLPISGTFVGGDDVHPAAGSFEISASETGKTLSFSEDFSVRRGPDLFVWLVQGDDLDNRVVIKRLQRADGAQTYNIPGEVNLAEYDRVLVWCRAFRVRANSAQLSKLRFAY